MSPLTRRTFLHGTTATSVLAAGIMNNASSALGLTPRNTVPARPAPTGDGKVPLSWLDGSAAGVAGSTWGVAWPKGTVSDPNEIGLQASDGRNVPLQSWATARWPDGSLKWTGHAVGAGESAESYTLVPGTAPAPPKAPVTVQESSAEVVVDTGVARTTIPRSGDVLVSAIARAGKNVAVNGRLVSLHQKGYTEETNGRPPHINEFLGQVEEVAVEQKGPLRAVVRVKGIHAGKGKKWLPFTVRLVFIAGAESFRLMHTFVWDGDPAEDVLRGLGIRFEVPMIDALHDRHVRVAGQGGGFLAEAVRPITGLRRDPGENVRKAQVAGRPTPPISSWDTRVSSRLDYIPAFGDYSLSQANSDGFTLRKRTKKGTGWVRVSHGSRSDGFAYVGGISGGLGIGLKNFWELNPTQLDISGAAGDTASITMWLWSPDAGEMDMRFYHDGLGLDTYEKQLDALNVTYEDYEPGFGTPYGVARTSELMVVPVEATPPVETLANYAAAVRQPPLLVASPGALRSAGVFGDWSEPVRDDNVARNTIEDRLDFLFDYYVKQRETHRWYGFWDFGDVMHTYDGDRHQWRYDIGGYAWANSELSPDLWLWYAYLRSGRADIFRFAEDMTRHTGEVDVYHLGEWAKLGTRHGVQHWADSAKQLRISTAAYRRFYYFLTADERTGDLLRELVDSDQTFLGLDPIRKIRTEPYEPDRNALSVGTGTDWSGLAAAWLTEWERDGDPSARDRLLGTMADIAGFTNGFIHANGLYDLDKGRYVEEGPLDVSHLSAVFGLVEINSELISLTKGTELEVPGFEDAWLQYCRLYNASRAQQKEETGYDFGSLNLQQPHSRVTAYAAEALDDDALAARAWEEFGVGRNGYVRGTKWKTQRVEAPYVLEPFDEAPFVSTNATSQYALAAIQNLALIGDKLPSNLRM